MADDDIKEGRHRCENIITKSMIYDTEKHAIIVPRMAQMDGDNTKIVRIFFGTRADLAPYPMTYLWDCECCHAPTYSAAEPPPDQRLVCNVCVSQLSAMAEQSPNTRVGWGITDEGWDIIDDMAEEKQRPVEVVFNRVMEWQLRRPIRGELYRKPEKKKKK
jgi:hypothetical protein